MDWSFQCGTCTSYSAFKNINDFRKTIKILDVNLISSNEVSVDHEQAAVLDAWVGQMYDNTKTEARARR